MKNTKKVLLGGVAALALVGTSVFGTYMYLTSDAKVENTFAVGKVVIDLDESDTDNDINTKDNKTYIVTVDGKKVEITRDKANNYRLYPNHTYTKDPTVWVDASSEDCYLFVTVENGISDIEAASTTDGYQNIADQMAAKHWVPVLTSKKSNLYVYSENGTEPTVVSAGAKKVIFDSFKIDSEVDNDGLADFSNAKITVNAYAVQADGFADKTAAEIYEAAFSNSGK